MSQQEHATCTDHLPAVWERVRHALETYGVVGISLDMETYGREPGDVAWVTVGFGPDGASACGRICEAVEEAIRLVEAKA